MNQEEALNRPYVLEMLESVFPHNIGTVVCHVALAHRLLAEHDINAAMPLAVYRTPPAMVIVERDLRQCHGGVQGFYTCRVDSGATASFAIHEIVTLEWISESIKAAALKTVKARVRIDDVHPKFGTTALERDVAYGKDHDPFGGG